MEFERRQSHRKSLHRPAKVAPEHGHVLDASTADVGTDGISIFIEESLPIGTKCLISFEIPMGGKLRKVVMVVKVKYCTCCGLDGFRIGMERVEIEKSSAETVEKFLE